MREWVRICRTVLEAADAGTATVGGQRYASLRQPMRVLGSLLDAGALQPSRTAGGYYLLSPFAGLGVLALWTAAALVLGALAFRLRDA